MLCAGIEKELSVEEKLIEREIADAGKLLADLEKSYIEDAPWFRFFQFWKN